MTTLIQINLINNSNSLSVFCFFEQPANYNIAATVYSNCLQSTALLPYSSSGARYTLQLTRQIYAGVEEQVISPGSAQILGYLSAAQQINIAPPVNGPQTNNATNMIVSPLGLSAPTPAQDVKEGFFRIVTPTFDASQKQYHAGPAVEHDTGAVILSSFIKVKPTSYLDCQPIPTFYVAMANFSAGEVINFTSLSKVAAVCDATSGVSSFKVIYNVDGTWTVTSNGQGPE